MRWCWRSRAPPAQPAPRVPGAAQRAALGLPAEPLEQPEALELTAEPLEQPEALELPEPLERPEALGAVRAEAPAAAVVAARAAAVRRPRAGAVAAAARAVARLAWAAAVWRRRRKRWPGTGGAAGGSSGQRPCDIYAAGNTPCVAAHSTIRALFGAYSGALYQVKRADGMTRDIPVVSPGAVADASVQDTFCMGTTCTIWRIYDQSGRGNFLEAETPESSVGGFRGMTATNASAESLMVGGRKVYSLYTRGSQAYWRNGSQSGMPTGSQPQGIYMVTSGTHVSSGCCFDYGNAQVSRVYEGGPTMDAIYFGTSMQWSHGAGAGPWILADMEDGMIAWGSGGDNPNLPSMPFRYVTAMEKNDGTATFALKAADATSPTLNTYWSGALPASKRPMRKQGAIVLGSGGDCCLNNSNLSFGTFYEGAIVAGYPTDATDNAIHANIVAAGYGR